MNSMNSIAHADLQSWLRYDIETGDFFWLKNKRGKSRDWYIGDKAGYVVKAAMNISLLGRYYYVHRLVWFYVFGEWPKGDVDHIDGDWSNNRIGNLRDVSHGTNMENMRRARKDNRSGLLGAHKHGNGFCSAIQVKKKLIRLGWFATAQEAHAAYLKAKRELHPGCTI